MTDEICPSSRAWPKSAPTRLADGPWIKGDEAGIAWLIKQCISQQRSIESGW
jgi:hypothetical protein